MDRVRATAKSDPSSLSIAFQIGAREMRVREFKPEQKEAIRSILCGEDVFVTLPTGFGKSAIYQSLPYCVSALASLGKLPDLKPFVLVVSPLIALMRDQVSSLNANGVKATYLGGHCTEEEQAIIDGDYSHLFTSPEYILQVPKWRKMLLSSDSLTAIAIDEAHCIVKWGMGNVFREWYGKVSQLRSLVPSNTPVIALTATSTLNVQLKITQHLGMDSCAVVRASLDRPNIRYSVVKASRDLQATFGWLLREIEVKRTNLQRTVVFCRSIKTCASLFKLFLTHLREKSYEPVGSEVLITNRLFAMFHAKIDDSDKNEILTSLKDPDGKCRLVFSTVAFGMGVNIPDIRNVIHYGPPGDIDDYYQECGRGGRDGKESYAVLYLFGGCTLGHVSPKMKEYCKLSKGCRRKFLLQQFSNEIPSVDTFTFQHQCCDLCAMDCKCVELKCAYTPCITELFKYSENDDVHEPEERSITSLQRQVLKEKLHEFKRSIVLVNNTDRVPLYIGSDLACGLPDYVIDLIVANCQYIHSIGDLEDKCMIWNYGNEIMDIIDEL